MNTEEKLKELSDKASKSLDALLKQNPGKESIILKIHQSIQALTVKPDDIPTVINLAIGLNCIGQYKQALEKTEYIITLFDKNKDVDLSTKLKVYMYRLIFVLDYLKDVNLNDMLDSSKKFIDSVKETSKNSLEEEIYLGLKLHYNVVRYIENNSYYVVNGNVKREIINEVDELTEGKPEFLEKFYSLIDVKKKESLTSFYRK